MFDLIQGDCLEKMKYISDKSIDMVLTDPPYGTTHNKWDSIIDLGKMWKHLKRIIKNNGAIILTSQALFTAHIQLSSPFYRYSLVWKKSMATGFLNARRMPLQTHEDITIHYKKLPTYNPQKDKGKAYTRLSNTGDRFPRSIISISKGNYMSVHPTQKPVALMEYLIKTYTNKGDTVLDFTMGSGTTGVACGNLNRKFIGIELDEKYFQIAEERILNAYSEGLLD